MMDYDNLEVFNKYIEIKKYIMDNLKDVHYRQNHFTKKFRGDRHKDINVSLGEDGDYKTVQIFVRFGIIYIKDNIKYSTFRNYFQSTIKSNLFNETDI